MQLTAAFRAARAQYGAMSCPNRMRLATRCVRTLIVELRAARADCGLRLLFCKFHTLTALKTETNLKNIFVVHRLIAPCTAGYSFS